MLNEEKRLLYFTFYEKSQECKNSDTSLAEKWSLHPLRMG